MKAPVALNTAAIDWDDLRYFLALARKGSLSGAARDLKTTQPTMGRRLAAFEAKLGALLFHRTPTGLRLTEAGDAILHFAVTMDEAAIAAERVAMGRDAGLQGTVRVTAPNFFGPHILSEHIGRFCSEHPTIAVDLITDARLANLARREADMAFRLRRFEQDDIYQTKVGELPFALYAAPSYLQRCGPPDFERGGAGSDTVVMDQTAIEPIAETFWLNETLPHAKARFRSNNRDGQAAAAAAGAGLVCLPCRLGDVWPGLTRIDTPTPVPAREVWLGMHADTRKVPRVRALADYLVACLRVTREPPAS
jgi:DNA-binding transcriptional LysR family regulator